MDRKPFEPADGATPRWQKLRDLVRTKEVGQEVTYREAAELLGLDHRDRDQLATIQGAMRDAVARLEKAGERTVSTVARFGWVVLDAQREVGQVDRRLTKTRRAAGRTLRGIGALNTRRGELSQFDRERLDWMDRSARIAEQAASKKRRGIGEIRKMLSAGDDEISA